MKERARALAIYFVIFLSFFYSSFFLAACLGWLNYGLCRLRRGKNAAEEEGAGEEETTMIRINWKH